MDEVKSYRPITLLPVLGKVFEMMIVGRICKHASETGVMSAGQQGFRTGLGTGTALRKLTDICDDTYEKWLVVVFADVGAFDNAWWPVIAQKLKEWGCSGNIIRILISYLENKLFI